MTHDDALAPLEVLCHCTSSEALLLMFLMSIIILDVVEALNAHLKLVRWCWCWCKMMVQPNWISCTLMRLAVYLIIFNMRAYFGYCIIWFCNTNCYYYHCCWWCARCCWCWCRNFLLLKVMQIVFLGWAGRFLQLWLDRMSDVVHSWSSKYSHICLMFHQLNGSTTMRMNSRSWRRFASTCVLRPWLRTSAWGEFTY